MPELLMTPAQWFGYAMRRRVRILMYHSISDDPIDPLAISPAHFRAQMSLLAQQGYSGVSLGEVTQLLTSGSKDHRVVGLTFDDGFQDFLTAAIPVLQEHGFRATLFVPAGMVGQTSSWSSYRKDRSLLTWEELQEVVNSGYEIGSHTLSHPDLCQLSPVSLHHEVNDSKRLLEDTLQVPVHHFAYPGGTFTQREVDAVGRAFYRSAAIVGGRWGNGPDTPRLRLKREPMRRSDTLSEFWRKVYGYYELFWLSRWILCRVSSRRPTSNDA